MKVVVVVLVCVIQCALCIVQHCSHTTSTGEYYDISPLATCNLKGQINICTTIAHYGCDPTQACCQLLKNVNYNHFDPVFNQVSPNYGCGSASSVLLSDLPSSFPASQKGVLLTYKGGDKTRNSTITLLCDPSATKPIVTFISESPALNFNFEINSSAACPLQPQPYQQQLCPINVFLVPHTHDDVGWLITPDQYFAEEVKNIIDTVLSCLLENPQRRFIYVEQAFFYRWWTDVNTTEAQRTSMKKVVASGQLEFVLGAWTMPDEAVTSYSSLIDEYTLGHSFLFQTFGVRPTKGWQIDPFGASTTTPTIGKLSGFDVQFIDRVSNKDEENANQRLQFNWQGSPSLGAKSEILGEIVSGSLYCDWLFPFDFTNDPVNMANVEQYAIKFVEMAAQYSTYYRSPNVLAEWGCDFAFQNATAMFNSMDKVVAWLQANQNSTGVFVKYSLLSDYSTAVFSWEGGQLVDNIPTNIGGDFMPHKFPGSNQWATGFYTSRVTLKGLARQGEAIGRVVETTYALALATNTSFDQNQTIQQNIVPLRMALAEATHHDGITGTSTPPVVLKYQENIVNGINVAATAAQASLLNLISSASSFSMGTGSLLTIANGQIVAVVLYNSLAWDREEVFAVAVNRLDLSVYDGTKASVPCQVNDAPYTMDNVTSTYRIFFPVFVPSLGFATYYFSAPSSTKSSNAPTCSYTPKKQMPLQSFTLESGLISVAISSTTGRISSISNNGLNVSVEQDVQQYYSDTSGPYNFGPLGDSFSLYAGTTAVPTNYLTEGPIVSELYQILPCTDDSGEAISSYVQQVVRVYQAKGFTDQNAYNFVDLEFNIGPLPSHTEIVTSFITDIQSGNSLFTDSNGYEFQERTYAYDNTISGNYYPIVYAAFIKDYVAQLSLITERAHGGASLQPGHIELMLHRNPDMAGDGGPALVDTDVAYPKLRLLVTAVSPLSSPSAFVPVRAHAQLENFPLTAFSTPSATVGSLAPASRSFAKSLPPNVHLLTFVEWGQGQFLIRLTHLYAIGDDPILSASVLVNIADLFTTFKISHIQETSLTANRILVDPSPPTVTLSPKDIRTFIISI